MPPKGRLRKSNVAAQVPAQAKLTFNKSTKVTKPTSLDKKTSSKLNQLAQDEIVEQISEPEPEEPTPIIPQVEPETEAAEDTNVAFRPRKRISKGTATTSQNSLDDVIIAAQKIKDAQINKYWKAEEAARLAPRVHQDGLPVHEKILRHFDLSSQYGPCIGIPRLNRWKRAFNLQMDPPIEVLAVLLREESKGVDRGDKKKDGPARQCGRLAYIDELAGGKAVLVD